MATPAPGIQLPNEVQGRRPARPARDSIHDAVVNALVKDGWEITDDPLFVEYGGRNLLIDLAATTDETDFVSLEQHGARIAVEIKSFSGHSPVQELERAVGQYVIYNLVLETVDPNRTLYLATDEAVLKEFFDEPNGRLVRRRLPLRIVAINCLTEEVVEWSPPPMPTF